MGRGTKKKKHRFLPFYEFGELSLTMALRATTFYVKRAGNKKILCDTNIETVTTSSFLTLLYFHISYLASVENCGKQLSRVGRIGALTSKDLGSNLCFVTTSGATGTSPKLLEPASLLANEG